MDSSRCFHLQIMVVGIKSDHACHFRGLAINAPGPVATECGQWCGSQSCLNSKALKRMSRVKQNNGSIFAPNASNSRYMSYQFVESLSLLVGSSTGMVA